MRFIWVWKRGFTAEIEYNNSSKTSLKLKTEFCSPLERQSSIPGSRHRASCAETDLMLLPLPAWLNFSGLVGEKIRRTFSRIWARDSQSHAPPAGEKTSPTYKELTKVSSNLSCQCFSCVTIIMQLFNQEIILLSFLICSGFDLIRSWFRPWPGLLFLLYMWLATGWLMPQ